MPSLSGLAWLLSDGKRFAEAEAVYRRTIAIYEKHYRPGHPAMLSTLRALSGVLRATNRRAEADALLRRAFVISDSAGPEAPDVAMDLFLVSASWAPNQPAETEPTIRRIVAINEKSLGPDHPNVAFHLRTLARLLQATNRHAEAEDLIRRVLAIDERVYGTEDHWFALDLNMLARALSATGRMAEADALYRRALATRQAG